MAKHLAGAVPRGYQGGFMGPIAVAVGLSGLGFVLLFLWKAREP